MIALRSLGAFQNGIHPFRSIRLYKSVVQTRWENASHLIPWYREMTDEVTKVERLCFTQLHGQETARQVHRCRAASRITDMDTWRKLLVCKMIKRLCTSKLALEIGLQTTKSTQELGTCEEDLLQATQDPEIPEEARATALDTDLLNLKTKLNKEATDNAEKLRPRPISAANINVLSHCSNYTRSSLEYWHWNGHWCCSHPTATPASEDGCQLWGRGYSTQHARENSP